MGRHLGGAMGLIGDAKNCARMASSWVFTPWWAMGAMMGADITGRRLRH